MFSRHRKARVLFGLSDILLTAAAFEAAYHTRTILNLERAFYLTAEKKALVLGFALLAWVAMALWLGIYEKLDSAHPSIILRDTARQCVYGFLCLVVFEYLLRLELSRPFLVLFASYAWTVLLLFRLTAGRLVGLMRREFWQPHYVMVVGTGERAIRLARALEESTEYNVKLRGFLSQSAVLGNNHSPGTAEISIGSNYPVWPIANLPSILRQHVVDEILFAVDSESLAELEETFLLCDEEGVRTGLAVDFFPHVNSTLSLDRFGSIPLLTFSAAPYDEVRLLVKRLTDVAIAAAGLAVLSPLMVVIAVFIRLTSPGPAIFTQVRCGLNGRRFRFYKFRSMCRNAEELGPALAHLTTRKTALKIPDDPRAHAPGTVPAKVFRRRMAAVVERAARRHVAGGAASGRPERGGAIQAVAAPPVAHAPGPDLPVGGFRARSGGFRNLDEDGHAVH